MVCFTILNFCVLIGSIIFIFFNYYYSLALFMFFFINFLVISIMFYKKTLKYPKNEIKEFIEFKDIWFRKHNNKGYYIEFTKENNFWVCKAENKIIKFNLQGYKYEKQFICAYIIRSLRYPLISRKKPIIELLKYKYNIPAYKNEDLYVVFNSKNKRKEVKIVYKGVSQYSVLSREISKSPFYSFFLHERSMKWLKRVEIINEKIYLEYNK